MFRLFGLGFWYLDWAFGISGNWNRKIETGIVCLESENGHRDCVGGIQQVGSWILTKRGSGYI